MPRKQTKHGGLIAKRWVHIYEEDTEEGEVYRPETENIPLSRRPREAFELDQNGAAHVFLPGPDDRMSAIDATWHDEKGAIVLRAPAGRGHRSVELRVVEASRNRLLVRR
jgi:hypothetical protein